MVDTNADPTEIDYVIPSNDDAIRAVKLIVSVIANAVEEGLRIREVNQVDIGQVSKDDLADMEQYLGPSTLAKLQGAEDDETLDEGSEVLAVEPVEEPVEELVAEPTPSPTTIAAARITYSHAPHT